MVFALSLSVLEIVRGNIAESLPDQRAAARWGGGSAQVSVFFAADRPYSVSAMQGVARQIDDTLTDASLSPPEGGRLWYHAYSTEREAYIMTDRDGFTATATLIGGDYFFIHEAEMISGAILGTGAAADGAVVLDENAAFRLFGALDVVGSTVTVEDQYYTVAGVCRVPENRFYDGYGDAPRIYLTYSSAAGRNTSSVTAWEAVLPNPTRGFAAGVAADLFGGYEKTAVQVENSARFTIPALWKLMGERKTQGVRTSAITYPWYENVARVAEFTASAYLKAQAILLGCAAVLLLVVIGALWKPTERAITRLSGWTRNKWDDAWEWLTIPEVRKKK